METTANATFVKLVKCTNKNKLVIKHGYYYGERHEMTDDMKEHLKRCRAIKKWRIHMLEVLKSFKTDPKERELIDLMIAERDIGNIKRSVNRTKGQLNDIADCNRFQYFVTLTFDKSKVNRLDDSETRKKFTQWANYVRKLHPSMFYLAVPEYHKKGALHFHLLIGGVSFDDLKCQHWKDINGKPIYIVGRWRTGYSTLSVIENLEKTKNYILKYLTKQSLDERFFGKKRFYVSRNIVRPEVIKNTVQQVIDLNNLDRENKQFSVAYYHPRTNFMVLEFPAGDLDVFSVLADIFKIPCLEADYEEN